MMFIQYFKPAWLISLGFMLAMAAVQADIYKWVDDEGQTHYSQFPPETDKPVTIDVVPPPPTQTQSQQKLDALIEQQQQTESEQEKAAQQARESAEQRAAVAENCERLRYNLTQYETNPGSRIQDADGNITRLDEADRQRNIQDLHQQIERYCQ